MELVFPSEETVGIAVDGTLVFPSDEVVGIAVEGTLVFPVSTALSSLYPSFLLIPSVAPCPSF